MYDLTGVQGIGKSPRRACRRIAAGFITTALALVIATSAAAAPYEPNDSISAAAGPLVLGQTYEASLETQNDRDFYYFYVSSPSEPLVAPTIKNLGSGPQAASVAATIVDSEDSPIDAFAYFLGAGSEATASKALAPQKYFIEVRSSSESQASTTYSLTPGGGRGAFGPYSAISSRCKKGTAAVRTARHRLSRAQARLQRASARLHQAPYLGASERQRVQLAHRRAKIEVTDKRKALGQARKLLQPWCSIPQ